MQILDLHSTIIVINNFAYFIESKETYQLRVEMPWKWRGEKMMREGIKQKREKENWVYNF